MAGMCEDLLKFHLSGVARRGQNATVSQRGRF